MTSLQLGGYDPLDAQLDEAAAAAPRQVARSWSRLPLAGWSAHSVPAATLLGVGIILGPQGVNLLSPRVLSLLDPAIPVALAFLGALVGLSINLRHARAPRLAGLGLLESALTAAVVAVPLALVPSDAVTSAALPAATVAAVMGFCAASSLAVPASPAAGPPGTGMRLLAFDSLLPIVGGAFLLAFLGGGSPSSVLSLVTQATGISLLMASAAWLLMSQAASTLEQRVFSVAAMLLVGGVADYLSLSALFTGMLAGVAWNLVGGPAREAFQRDALFAQHSLLVLVLVVAGAHSEVSRGPVIVGSAYVVLRMAGKIGGVLAATHARFMTPSDVPTLQLLSPGIFGVALALAVARAVGAEAVPLLSTIVFGTIGAELVAELARSRAVDAAPLDRESDE